MSVEQPVTFGCEGARLIGVLHRPERPRSRGLLIVVGGPQYRVGSHRQFVGLARHMAAAGVPVLRFDYRGMGDSEGPAITFEEAGPDLRAALDAFFAEVRELRDVALWGLCDAASAALMYGTHDPRVAAIVLANPWVRTAQTEAQTYMRHYYWTRLRDPQQWRKFLSGRMDLLASVRDFLGKARVSTSRSASSDSGASFVARMLEGLTRFRGRTLVILSGDDLTAAEFKDRAARSPQWTDALARASVSTRELAEANHTFARSDWRNQVAEWTRTWMESL